jgi:hypothetical protein
METYIDGDQVLPSLFALVVADEVAFALGVPVEVAVASTLAIEPRRVKVSISISFIKCSSHSSIFMYSIQESTKIKENDPTYY